MPTTWGLTRYRDNYPTKNAIVVERLLNAGAVVFGKFLAITRIPFNVASWIGGFDLPPFVIMGMIVLVYFLGGCFMDALALVMLTVPIFLPVVASLGYDPIWFGIIVVKMAELCLITPPIGLNCFVVAGVRDDISVQDVFRGASPFFIADVITVGVLISFPGIVLWLPRLLLG